MQRTCLCHCLSLSAPCLSLCPLSQAFGLIRFHVVEWRTAAKAQQAARWTRKRYKLDPVNGHLQVSIYYFIRAAVVSLFDSSKPCLGNIEREAIYYGSECMYRIPNTAGAPTKEQHTRCLKTKGKGKRCNVSGDYGLTAGPAVLRCVLARARRGNNSSSSTRQPSTVPSSSDDGLLIRETKWLNGFPGRFCLLRDRRPLHH